MRGGSPVRAMTAFGIDSALLASDVESFRLQESIFTILNLLLIAVLLAMEPKLAPYRGTRPLPAEATLAAALAMEAAKLVWLRADRLLSPVTRTVLTWWSIVFNTALVAVLFVLMRGEDTQYYVLMVVPVLEAAFRLRLVPTVAVIAAAYFLNFLMAHSLGSLGEYLEAAAASLIFTVVGVTVWLLVNNLREREVRLERTRERLLVEEKLAAVGRLSSAIAHEIRNPVAMISSSLAMAARPALADRERQEMLGIAASEASRLERLTSDFLAYARPRAAQIARANVADVLNYVIAIARAHAADRGVALEVNADGKLEGDFDTAQMHQALLNLVLNAIDACRKAGPVTLSAEPGADGGIRIDVTDPDGPIPPEASAHLFEPFFTTKPGGTGLGLATARNIARLHRGELALTINRPGRVCFSITIPGRSAGSPRRSGNP